MMPETGCNEEQIAEGAHAVAQDSSSHAMSAPSALHTRHTNVERAWNSEIALADEKRGKKENTTDCE